MNLRDLEYLVALADYQHYARQIGMVWRVSTAKETLLKELADFIKKIMASVV